MTFAGNSAESNLGFIAGLHALEADPVERQSSKRDRAHQYL
jgi:hypothetical protein